MREQLREIACAGIDVYFDNVGGDHLEAALDVMRNGGRAALCGAISAYNATERTPGPDNMMNIISRGLTLEGFTLGNYTHIFPEFAAKMGPGSPPAPWSMTRPLSTASRILSMRSFSSCAARTSERCW